MKSFFLSEAHTLLLQAALGHGPAAVRAYRSWSRQLDFDKVDVASQRVLPLLVANSDLRAAVSSDDEVMRRCAKVTRFTWLKSRLLMAETAPVVAAFGEADIPVLALKGAAVVAHTGGRLAERPMDDVDLAVPAPAAARALAVSAEHGFVPEGRVPGQHELASWLRYDHGLELRNERGAAIDLHWHVCGLQLSEDTDEHFWRRAVPGSVGTAECALTSLSHTIVLVLAHAMVGPAVSLRWATDTVALLRSPAGAAVQWDAVVELARRLDIAVGVGCAFQALERILGLEVPPAVHRLRRTPSGPQQIERRLAFRRSHLSRRPSRAEVVNAAYLEHARRTATRGVVGGAGFLSSWCAVEHPSALARRAIRRASGGRLARLDDARERPFPPLAEGEEVRFDLGGKGHEHLGLGWSQPEAHGTWSAGREATFGADLPWRSAGAITMSLCFVPFLPPLRPHVGVVLSVGGTDVDRWELFGPGWLPALRAVTVSSGLLASGLRGRFRFDYPLAPDAVGPTAGARALSIAMFSLRVDRA